nr:hypothetical protein [Salmonid herpesvirus 1]
MNQVDIILFKDGEISQEDLATAKYVILPHPNSSGGGGTAMWARGEIPESLQMFAYASGVSAWEYLPFRIFMSGRKEVGMMLHGMFYDLFNDYVGDALQRADTKLAPGESDGMAVDEPGAIEILTSFMVLFPVVFDTFVRLENLDRGDQLTKDLLTLLRTPDVDEMVLAADILRITTLPDHPSKVVCHYCNALLPFALRKNVYILGKSVYCKSPTRNNFGPMSYIQSKFEHLSFSRGKMRPGPTRFSDC